MTAYEKLAISFPLRAAEHAGRAVRQPETTSMSAYIAAAVETQVNQESLSDLLDGMLDESEGPVTKTEWRGTP